MPLMRERFQNLDDALVHEPRGLHDAEHRLTGALPRMANAAKAPEWRPALNEHPHQTEEPVRRREEVFRHPGQEPRRQSCPDMEGIIDERPAAIKALGSDEVGDAPLMGAAQETSHAADRRRQRRANA